MAKNPEPKKWGLCTSFSDDKTLKSDEKGLTCELLPESPSAPSSRASRSSSERFKAFSGLWKLVIQLSLTATAVAPLRRVLSGKGFQSWEKSVLSH